MDPLPSRSSVDPPLELSEAHDRLLMARIAAGDERSFAVLLHRFWRRIASFSGRLAGSADAGEDIAQEVFVRVWEHRDDWKPAGSVQSYLYRIARNLAVDEHRRRLAIGRSIPELLSMQSRPVLPLRSAEQRELREALEAAVDRLPPRRREVFLLVHGEGLSYREVAEILQIAVPTVANQLSSALADLRRELRQFISVLS